jgi:hypothetical protein
VSHEIKSARKLAIPAPGHYNVEPEKIKGFLIKKTPKMGYLQEAEYRGH